MTNPTADNHDQYLPSPSRRVNAQVRLYEASDGSEGGTLERRPVILLTCTRARTRTPKDADHAHPER
jgi:F420H(2)-dependent quinone reductase